VNTAVFRRYWMHSLIVAAAFSTSVFQSLNAQEALEQPGPSEPPAAAPGQLKTMAVIAGARNDKLMSDISFLGPLVGRPEAGQLAEMVIGNFTAGKAATALDKTKPWGLILQTDGAGYFPLVCLPVAKIEDVLEIAKLRGADIKDGENGIKVLMMPGGQTIFVKPQNGVMFFSKTPASLSRLPANPQEILASRVGDYDVSAVLAVKNVPESTRQLAITAVRFGLAGSMRKATDESDEKFAERQRFTQARSEQLVRMINEIESVRIGWAIDAQQKRSYVDFAYEFAPGSKMAQQAAAYGQSHTNFAGFYQPDAAATFLGSVQADPKVIGDDLDQYAGMVRTAREKVNKEIDTSRTIDDPAERAALKAELSDFFDAVESTIREGQVDGGASLRLAPQMMTFVAGLHMKNPDKLESALKKLEPAMSKDPSFPGIKWNAANHAGVKFHTFAVPLPETETEARRLFGNEVPTTVGIGSDSVYFGCGKDNVELLNKAIDASETEHGKAVPPLRLELALVPFLEVSADAKLGQKVMARGLAEMLKTQSPGRDHVRIAGHVVPNGMSYRLEVEEGMLRMIGLAQQQPRTTIRRSGR
jgi:hypothetical protein